MKVGLVLEGGANRTIFTSGVLDAMIENDIKTDYVVGVSAGIAYGVNYVSWQKGRTLAIFDKYLNDKRYMGVRHFFNKANRSFFNMDFAYNTIPNKLIPFDYDKYKSFSGDVEAVVTNVHTGNPEYKPVPYDDKDFNILRASCALPLLFPFIYIDEQPYMDGGLADAIPFKRAFDKGCDKIIAVLTREKGYNKGTEKSQKLIRWKYRKYPDFLRKLEDRANIYNEQRNQIFELEKQGKALIFMPDSTKDFSRTEKNMDKVHALYEEGYKKACNRAEELKGFFA